MPFKKTPQTFSAAIKAVEIGTGDKAITIGGENVLPLYSFDAEIANAPKIGVEILDTGFENAPAGLKAFYEGCTSMADMAKKAATIEGASFICLHFEGADPNGADRSIARITRRIPTCSTSAPKHCRARTSWFWQQRKRPTRP